MKPVEIPDAMGIEGAQKRTISGGEIANDVEALVGVDEKQFPFFAMLMEVDELDLKHLHLDPRFWHFQMGAPLHPFRMEPAFVSPVAPGGDPVAEELRAAGKLLGAAWYEHARGNHAGVQKALGGIIEKVAAAESARKITAGNP